MMYNFFIVVDFVRIKFFNGVNIDFFYVICYNIGECMVQVGSQYFNRLIWVKFQISYIFVRWFKWYL